MFLDIFFFSFVGMCRKHARRRVHWASVDIELSELETQTKHFNFRLLF